MDFGKTGTKYFCSHPSQSKRTNVAAVSFAVVIIVVAVVVAAVADVVAALVISKRL